MTRWLELTDDEDRVLETFMSRVASIPVTFTMSDPRPLWWKAQLVKRWDAERHAHAPLDVIERVEIVAGLAAAAVLLVWAAPAVVRVIAAPFLALLG